MGRRGYGAGHGGCDRTSHTTLLIGPIGYMPGTVTCAAKRGEAVRVCVCRVLGRGGVLGRGSCARVVGGPRGGGGAVGPSECSSQTGAQIGTGGGCDEGSRLWAVGSFFFSAERCSRSQPPTHDAMAKTPPRWGGARRPPCKWLLPPSPPSASKTHTARHNTTNTTCAWRFRASPSRQPAPGARSARRQQCHAVSTHCIPSCACMPL